MAAAALFANLLSNVSKPSQAIAYVAWLASEKFDLTSVSYTHLTLPTNREV